MDSVTDSSVSVTQERHMNRSGFQSALQWNFLHSERPHMPLSVSFYHYSTDWGPSCGENVWKKSGERGSSVNCAWSYQRVGMKGRDCVSVFAGVWYVRGKLWCPPDWPVCAQTGNVCPKGKRNSWHSYKKWNLREGRSGGFWDWVGGGRRVGCGRD